ncbi:MAG: adenosylcobinamide-GDP ribazoletransferase [Sphingobium sp.]|nr:MAG: adenosylcobinamide-GDP ribazoletransferase [Sphingobium sp.]
MKGLILALQFLTRLPLPRIDADAADFAASMRWFPAAGLIVGLLVAGGARLGVTIDAWTGALFALATWVLVTGALHLDGLADITDAAGAAHKGRERLLAVLSDPHVGGFGVVAVALQLIAKLVLLHGLLANDVSVAALALVPAIARVGPIAWTLWLPPLHEGLAARFRPAARSMHLVLWTAILCAAALWCAPALLVAILLVPLWAWRVRRTIGGISGDGHGAGIELVETGLLLALLIGAHST